MVFMAMARTDYRIREKTSRVAGRVASQLYDEGVVRTGGLEPPLPYGKRILSPLRLPIPPRPRALARY